MHTKVLINDLAYEIDGDSLTGSQLKALAHQENVQLYRLHRDERIEIQDQDVIGFQGDDRFVTVPPAGRAPDEDAQRVITIFVDGDPYQTGQRVLTGAQIKALANKPPENRLFRLAGEGQRIPIADDEKLHLHDGEQFVTLPPVGRAS